MLQLRQIIDKILMQEGLAELHLERNKVGHLLLCGPCGQPFINIYGITVPPKLSRKERDYVSKLVTNHIIEKADDIDYIMSEKKKNKKPEDISSDFKLATIYGYSYPHNNINKSIKQAKLIDPSFKTKFSIVVDIKSPKNYKITLNNGSPEDLIQIQKNMEKYLKILDKYVIALIEQEIIDKKIQKLSSCNL